MMHQIENRMVVDSQWEDIEGPQMRIPDQRSKRHQKVIDELEYGVQEGEDYESL